MAPTALLAVGMSNSGLSCVIL